jgi:hypothetical protein
MTMSAFKAAWGPLFAEGGGGGKGPRPMSLIHRSYKSGWILKSVHTRHHLRRATFK